jgi:putative PIN family toxin of toxin-antitoxin system
MKNLAVMDTNIVVSALRSRRGASFLFLSNVFAGKISLVLSVPLAAEYEDVLMRHLGETPYTKEEATQIIDRLYYVATLKEIYYLWRPFLRDAGDDHVLELAVASGCVPIVTFNTKDFNGAERFGVDVMTPQSYLEMIGEL